MAVSAKRKAKIVLETDASGVAPGVNDAKRQLRAFQREQTRSAKQAAAEQKRAAKDAARAKAKEERDAARARDQHAAGLKGAAGSVLAGAGMAAGFDVAGGLGGLASNVFDVEKELTRFGIDAQINAKKLDEFRDATRRSSDATGQSQKSIVEAAHAYQILTGDAEGAVSQSRLFAEVANASGGSMHDIAEVAASMNKNLGIDPKNFRQGFDVLLNMGHKASVELRDFAGEMSTLNPLFKEFGNRDAATKLAEMSAALEVTKYNFANAAEASTGFKQAMTQVSKTKVADRLSNVGVDVWKWDPASKSHVKADWFDLITQIHNKIKDKKVLSDILGGRSEAYRAITAQLDHYDEMVKLKNESNNSDQVAKDNATWMESSTGRLTLAWEHVKNAVAAAFTPDRVVAFTDAIVEVSRAIEPVVGFLGKVAGFLGGVAGVGKSIRGALGGNDPYSIGLEDNNLANTGDVGRAQLLLSGMSEAEADKRIAIAKRHQQQAIAGNSAVHGIMDAEVDDKASPASIRMALAAKYSGMGVAEGGNNVRSAGAAYLKAAGAADPVAMQQRETNRILGQIAELLKGPIPASLPGSAAMDVAIRNAPNKRTK